MYAGPGGNRGAMTAWDPVRRKPAWEMKENLPLWSGALVTAGDVVFYGTIDGWFKAVDARSGKLLWKFKTESGIIGQPISYRGPDGQQYIAVWQRRRRLGRRVVSGGFDPRDPTAGAGHLQRGAGSAEIYRPRRKALCLRPAALACLPSCSSPVATSRRAIRAGTRCLRRGRCCRRR